MILTYLIIFILAAIPFFEAMVIIPIAIVGGLPAIPVIIVAILGNLLTVTLLIVFISIVKGWIWKRKAEDETPAKRTKKAERIWKKYGLPGLSMIGPFIVGTHLSAFMSLMLGGTKRETFKWITGSIIAWSLILGFAAHYGFDFFIDGDNQKGGFITRLIQD